MKIGRPAAVLELANRHFWFGITCVVSAAVFWPSLGAAVKLSAADDRYSHLIFIPLISAAVAYIDRKRIFREARYCPRIGAPALVLFAAGAMFSSLTVSIAALVGVWMAAFVLCHGPRALKAGAFPILFLLLAIPLPAGIVERISAALQVCSAEMAYGLFKLFGVPVFREGFTFSLPGIAIEVAEECSGIRSSIALVISGLLAGHVFLRSGWAKGGLVIISAVVAVFKNAVRIVFLSSMTAYTNQDFLNSKLHHQWGGLVFSCFAVAMIVPFLMLLRKSEGRAS